MSQGLITALVALLLLASATTAGAARTMQAIEEAAEVSTLDIRLSSDFDGSISARICDYCELLTLRVDAETQVFLRGARTALRTAEERKTQGATVIFDRETRVVKRILLWD
jgi:hypothetical protein